MKHYFKNNKVIFGSGMIASLIIIAVFAPYLALHDTGSIDLSLRLSPPTANHPFGTDQLGRDVFSRMAFGTRISLMIGVTAVGIAVLLGLLLGSVAGYYGGTVDAAIMRFIDIMLCFPSFFLILAVVAILEPNIINVMIIIGLTSWMGVARLVRAEILTLKERDFVLAAKAMGARPARIIIRHLIPNALGPVLVAATLGVGAAILIESALSFLGLGVQPPTPSWGNILLEGKETLGVAWWLLLFPGLAIFITVLSYNILGEGLQETLDPKKRELT